jgi:hypothetical protein
MTLMPSLASRECELFCGVPPLVPLGTEISGQSPPDSSHSRDASEGYYPLLSRNISEFSYQGPLPLATLALLDSRLKSVRNDKEYLVFNLTSTISHLIINLPLIIPKHLNTT